MFLPALSQLVAVDVRSATTHHWAEVRVPPGSRDLAAFRVAFHIVWNRCGGAMPYLSAWLDRYQGGPAHDPDLLACLEAFVGSESIGTVAAPANQVHLEGFVAEHVWHLLTLEDALGITPPLRVDGPDWSVTDSGGDGLAIYLHGADLSFRLWESKAHTGAGVVRDVVTGACRQIDRNALRYLARFSKVGQSLLEEPSLQDFYGRMPELWRNGDRAAGGGVAVATSSIATEDWFGGFASYWAFTDRHDQRQGLVVLVEDFDSFAMAVREHVWKGL